MTHWTRRVGPASVCASASASVKERSDSETRAIPPTLRYCGGIHS